MTPSWQTYFTIMADLAASRSKDPSRKVGAIIVGPHLEVRATGYNGIPRNVADLPERMQRPAKYLWTEHAERNAIYNAALTGVSTQGCTLFVQYHPCADCARAIIQSGIAGVYCPPPDMQPRWSDSMTAASLMLAEAGVEVNYIGEVLT